MRPSKKPLFKPPPPTTLDHFFTKPALSRRVKASHLVSQIKQHAKHALPPATEIIVLDSDDDGDGDEPTACTKRKAEDRSESSSDIEPTNDASSSRKKVKAEPGPVFNVVDTQDLFMVSRDKSLHFAEFGRPKLLVPEEDVTPIAEYANFEAGSAVVSNDQSLIPVPLFFADPDARKILPKKIDDDWGTGDDEVVRGVLELTDDDEIEEVLSLKDEPSPVLTDALDQCPFCESSLMSISPLDIQSHINSCYGTFSHTAPSHTLPLSPHNSALPPANRPFFRPTKANGGRRKAPFYKVLHGMPIAVDAFRYGAIPGVTSYFLTHAHSDHYTNLSSTWQAGPIYCSESTANLIIHMLSSWLNTVLLRGPQTVDAGDSTYKSSHVGSTRIFRYLHCGDFRAKRIDIIYLDTTYLNPRYLFPAQTQVISACAELAKRLVSGQGMAPEDNKGSVSNWITLVPKSETKGDAKPNNTLVVVGYLHPYQPTFPAIAKALQTKVYCDSRKAAILRCQSDPELHGMLTTDPFSANVHLVPLGVVTSDRLKEYIKRWKGYWIKVIAFRPTGWTYSPPAGAGTVPSIGSILARPPHCEFTYEQLRPSRGSTSTAQLFGVPYSEHSSFFELTCFALSLDWARMIATVNVESVASRAKIITWIARWEAERKKRPPGVVPYRDLEYW
ncbi:DNA repair metallo-beta-lactamase-domain-containing protein [Multifurca ochricompacta]|uniref:DNA repair metallo-beta-lactamase-domain-containing protein n=1 Tax=Multifurca ochricompacta TaxID=376703 RepID=A0AAD4M9M6_9AGAM|nr:DNA repair metallo-beta-lactamase-domain-containing protein [Multifurca ochricompacta]